MTYSDGFMGVRSLVSRASSEVGQVGDLCQISRWTGGVGYNHLLETPNKARAKREGLG